MELFFTPFACSLAAHITCLAAEVPVELRRVYPATKTVDGLDFRAISPKGLVPVLRLDDGSVLTEGAAILQYIAHLAPERGLVPERDSLAHWRTLEWLSFVATEMHKPVLNVLFSPITNEGAKARARELAPATWRYVEEALAERERFLIGDRFGIADAYLYWALVVSPHAGVPLTDFPACQAFVRRIYEEPSVRRAVAFERELLTNV